MKIRAYLATAALSGLLFAGMTSTAYAGLIGPLVDYESFADSPFSGQSFSYFHYEDFESGTLSAPGVTALTGFVVGPGFEVDSVEGQGEGGHSFFTLDGAGGLTFNFSAAVLGQLPTDVGIVWTDGDVPERHFTAYDQNGVSLGTINDGTGLFFSTGGDGAFQNYRFFGATNSGGISSIHISNDSGGIEVDDLQFGAQGGGVPEPASWTLMISGFGLAGLGLRRARRRLTQLA